MKPSKIIKFLILALVGLMQTLILTGCGFLFGGGLLSPSKPTIDPNGGTFTSPQSVTITAESSDGTDYSIYYTTDGTEPSEDNYEGYNWGTATLTVDYSITLKAISSYEDKTSAVTEAEFEILNAPADSPAIVSSVPKEGTISSVGNELFWKFSAIEGQIVSIIVTMPANPIDLHVKLMPESGPTLWEASDTNGADAVTTITMPNTVIPTSGAWYIKVYDEGNNESSTVPFILTMTLASNPDSNEPSNDIKTNAMQPWAMLTGTSSTHIQDRY